MSTGRQTRQLPGTGILGPAPCTPAPLSPCHVPSVPTHHMLALPGTCWWGLCPGRLQCLHCSPAASGSALPPRAAWAHVHTLQPQVHPLHPACPAALSTQGCAHGRPPPGPPGHPRTDTGRPVLGLPVPTERSARPSAEEGSLGTAEAARRRQERGGGCQGPGRGLEMHRPLHPCPCSIRALLLTPPIPSLPLHTDPGHGDQPKPLRRDQGCGCRFLGTDPHYPTPPPPWVRCRGRLCPAAAVLPTPKQQPGSFFVLTKQLLFGVKPPGSVSVCSPNSAALTGAGKGCLQKLLLPRHLPPGRAGAGRRCQLQLELACAKGRAVPIFPAWPR